MASFNAQEDANHRTRNQTGQCAPMQSPPLGTLKLVAGNGTSIGTVMTLQCPYKYRAVSGGRVSCVQDSDVALWSGGQPQCIKVPRYEDQGFRLAVLLSIISTAIIIFMSIIFITSCLLKRVRKEERRRMERQRKREDEALWQHMDIQEVSEGLYSHKERNNNNNNSKPQQHTAQPIHQSAASPQPCTLSDQQAACRYHQQDYLPNGHLSQPPLEAMPPTSYINTQTTCVLQSLTTPFPPPLPCTGFDPSLEQPPWKQSMPPLILTRDSAVTGVREQALRDPFWKDQRAKAKSQSQHPLDVKNPPIWVITV